MDPDLAHKITNILLELNNSELLHMLENHDSLKAKVDEIVTILREEMQMFEERLFPLIQSMLPAGARKITDKLLCLEKSELLHMLESHEFLKAKVDETVAVMEQKQMLGELLFPLVKSMVHDLAGNITGMLLEHNVSRLLQMLNHDSLKAYVDQAVPFLRAHLVCFMLYLCDLKKQSPSVSFTMIRVNM